MLLHEKEEALLYHKNIVTELEKDIEKLKLEYIVSHSKYITTIKIEWEE